MFFTKTKSYKRNRYKNLIQVRYSLSISAIALGIILCFFSDLSAGTSSVHTNLLFLHSYFDNSHWQRSGDTLDYDLPSSYTNLTPINASMAGNDSNNIALFSTSDKLYLMHVVLEPPPTITSNNKMNVNDPVESPVGSADSVFGLFAYTADNLDIVFLATVASNKIAVHHMIGQSFNVFKTDTLTINLPNPNCRITGLFGGPDLAKGSQSCIWAVGTHGLIRFFSWDGSAWSGETDYDIENQETVSAFSLEAVGTISGKIYIDQSGSFVFDSQPSTKPINQISAAGGACNDGTILKKKGALWSVFTKGGVHYNYFNFISRTDGSGVELLDGLWNYYLYALEDTLTTFDITPSNIASHINGSPYEYNDTGSETVNIHLIDPDGNCLVPEITLNSSIYLTIDNSDTLLSMHPDTECVPGFIDLSDTLLTITLTPDSLHFSAKARKAAFNPISYKYYWTYPTFTTSHPWSKYDQLRIKLGVQTLEIIFDGSTPISNNYNQKLKQPIVQSKYNQLIFTIPQNEIHSICIYNTSGRKIATANISPQMNNVILPVQIASGVIIIEYQFKNGNIKRCLLPVRK